MAAEALHQQMLSKDPKGPTGEWALRLWSVAYSELFANTSRGITE